MFLLGERSFQRLQGVHPFVIANIILGLMKYSEVDYGVGAGAVRTLHEQQTMVDNGKSETLKSYHLKKKSFAPMIFKKKYSFAVDLYPVGYVISEVPSFIWLEIQQSLDYAAKELNVTTDVHGYKIVVEHGLDWGRTPEKLGWDCPHHQWKFIRITDND